jgi:class 3 adenylate cyclase
MTFDEILAQGLDLLQRQGRVSYQALKRRFDLDDAYLEDLKVEIIQAQRLAIDDAMGAGARYEQLALGETPKLAARLQGLAAPDTIVISATTYRLVQGFFACYDLGSQTLKGNPTPVLV